MQEPTGSISSSVQDDIAKAAVETYCALQNEAAPCTAYVTELETTASEAGEAGEVGEAGAQLTFYLFGTFHKGWVVFSGAVFCAALRL